MQKHCVEKVTVKLKKDGAQRKEREQARRAFLEEEGERISKMYLQEDLENLGLTCI